MEVRIDVPRGSFVKRRPGRVPFVSPLPCPFDYGSVVGTRAEDGDAIDAIRLGAGPAVVRGVVRFIDGGRVDDKWIVGRPPTRAEVRGLRVFFALYAALKRLTGRDTRLVRVEV